MVALLFSVLDEVLAAEKISFQVSTSFFNLKKDLSISPAAASSWDKRYSNLWFAGSA